jgi:hypothetical protein
MITVTEGAKILLKDVRLERPEGTVLRLDPVDTYPENGEAQIGLRFGEPSDEDQVVEDDERNLLRISWLVSAAFAGSTLRVMQTPEGAEGEVLGIELPATEPPVSDDS